jgi:peptidoglycan/xylan/chitin deacetylase (PgdA/CDA1 family)
MLKKGGGVSTVKREGGGRSKLIILAYHAIDDLREDRRLAEYGVPGELFDEHLATLAADGWEFVDLDAVLAAQRGEGQLPPRALLISFDDAYVDLLDTGCPILERHGAPGLVFAVTDQIGGTNAWDTAKGAGELALLDAEGLRAVAARGVEVGAHTATHCNLPTVPAAQLEAELSGCADGIEAIGLPRPRAFSYPYGEWTPALAAAVREAGYETAFTVEWGAQEAGTDPFAVPRVEVHASDTPAKLKLKLQAATWPGKLRDLYLYLRGVRLDPSAG